jgi:hypothetical protein
LTWELILLQFPGNGARKLVDGAVLNVLENLIAFVDEVNGRPVGNPKRRFDEYSIKFFLSYETKVINPVGKSQRLKVMPTCFVTAPDNL